MKNPSFSPDNASDSELVILAHGGNKEAVDCLLERYKKLVRKLSAARFIAGGDPDDILQEGMIGLYKAIRDFDPENDSQTSFFTFASLCINRQMVNAIEASQRQKNRALNDSVTLTEEEWDNLSGESEISPERIVLEREGKDERLEKIRKSLSLMEQAVLDLHLSGYDYREISKMLGKPPKAIDNALQRIKKKAREQM